MGRDDGPLEMTTYTLTAPNGKTYDIEGPPGQSQDAVQAEILRRDPSAGEISTAAKVGYTALGAAKEAGSQAKGVLETIAGSPFKFAAREAQMAKGAGQAVTKAFQQPFQTARDIGAAASQRFWDVVNTPKTKEQAELRGAALLKTGEDVAAIGGGIAGMLGRGAGEVAAAREAAAGTRAASAAAGAAERRGIETELSTVEGRAREARKAIDAESAAERKRLISEANAKAQARSEAATQRRTAGVSAARTTEQASLEAQRRQATGQLSRARSAAKTAEAEQASLEAVKSSDLPVADASDESIRSGKEPLGARVRGRFMDAFKRALDQVRQDKSWKTYLDRGEELQKSGKYFTNSPAGISFISYLKSIIATGVEGGAKEVSYSAAMRKSAERLFDALVPFGEESSQRVTLEVVDDELRALRDLQYSKDATGPESIPYHRAKEMADELERHIKQYVGDEYYPREAYKKANEALDKFQHQIGQAAVGRPDLEYKAGSKYFKTPGKDLPGKVFGSEEGAAYAAEVLKPEEAVELAEQHVANETYGMDATKLQSWMKEPENRWIFRNSSYGEVQNKLRRTLDALAAKERNVDAIKASREMYEADIKRFKASIKDIASGARKERVKAEAGFEEEFKKETAAAEKERLKAVEKAGKVTPREREAARAEARAITEARREAKRKAGQLEKRQAARERLAKVLDGYLSGEKPSTRVAKFDSTKDELIKEGLIDETEAQKIRAGIAEQDARGARSSAVKKALMVLGAGTALKTGWDVVAPAFGGR